MEEDWSAEYLDAIIAAKLVDGVQGAIDHIETYGSHHTDCIVTENAEKADKFLREVDSAIVIHNASTQFADGGEFGFGAEIGIATGPHACARAGRGGAAHLVQICRPRRRTDAAVTLPPFARGMRIGLFGGSFNPPHAGHALVCDLALKRLGLDRIWLMVSPGNPLKSREGLPSLAERMAAARKMIRDPRVVVTGFEAEIGARLFLSDRRFPAPRLSRRPFRLDHGRR